MWLVDLKARLDFHSHGGGGGGSPKGGVWGGKFSGAGTRGVAQIDLIKLIQSKYKKDDSHR
jgi:hypothetical protein